MGNEDSPSVLAAFSFQNVTTAVTTTCRMFIFATGIAVIISDVGWRGFHFLGTIDMEVQHPDTWLETSVQQGQWDGNTNCFSNFL